MNVILMHQLKLRTILIDVETTINDDHQFRQSFAQYINIIDKEVHLISINKMLNKCCPPQLVHVSNLPTYPPSRHWIFIFSTPPKEKWMTNINGIVKGRMYSITIEEAGAS
ncbi:hypothetical protein LXL04_032438 [Taraxacum kok-saghyz]